MSMSGFKLSSELLIGGSSDLDAVFLPVNIDSTNNLSLEEVLVTGSPSWTTDGSGSSMGEKHLSNHHHHHHHHRHQQTKSEQKSLETQVLLEENVLEDEEEKETGPSLLVNAFMTSQPDSTDWCYRTTLISMGVIIIIIMFLVFGFDHIHHLLLWLEGVPIWQSIMILTVLFCIISFPVAWGLSLLMVTCGYLYGILYGPLVVALCSTISLCVSKLIMQSFCASCMRARFYSPRVEAMVNVVSGKHGMKIIALARLTPIPFGLQNALFSLSSISMPRYLISSVAGFIPMNLLHCYLGSTLRTMQDLLSYDSNHLVGYFIFGGQILLTVVLLWFVVRKARVELKKAMDESDKSSSELPNGDCSKTFYVNGL